MVPPMVKQPTGEPAVVAPASTHIPAKPAPQGQDESTMPYKQPPRPGRRSDFNDVPTKLSPPTARKPPPQFAEHGSLAAKPQTAPPPLPTDAVSLWRLGKLIPEVTCGLTLDLLYMNPGPRVSFLGRRPLRALRSFLAQCSSAVIEFNNPHLPHALLRFAPPPTSPRPHPR